jgi:hypothetical protein
MFSARELSGKIQEKFRYGVATKVVLDRIAMMGVRITPFYLVEERLFEELASEMETGFEGFEIDLLGPEDMEAIGRTPGYDVSTEQLLERLAKGQKCFGVRHEGSLAAFTWADLRECFDTWCRFPLAENEAYLFDAYTLEAFRGKRIAPFMRYYCYRALNQMGRDRFYSISEVFNAPSIRFKNRLKARCLSLWLTFELFGRHRWTVKLKDYPGGRALGDSGAAS